MAHRWIRTGCGNYVSTQKVEGEQFLESKVAFGRCAVTGEWGKCMSINLGDISVQAPDTENGVVSDPDGRVRFTQWAPVTFNTQVTLSEAGLQQLMDQCKSAENPLPTLNPDLVYGWEARYKNGCTVRQFTRHYPTEVETRYGDLELKEVFEMSLMGRGIAGLASYSINMEKGKFYQNGQPIDVGYEGDYSEDALPFAARKIVHTWGSEVHDAERSVTNAYTTVLYLLGWTSANGTRCLIAVDNRGSWRPFDYV